MSDPAPPLATGSRLVDRYELTRHIARGGMGDVWAAHDEQLQRPVAVKVFRGAAPADRARFEAEAVVLAALNHPGLVHVYDAGEHGGDAFLVLELVEGPTLAARLAVGGPLPAPEVAEIGAAVADALAYVHQQGVVHRDVTPANVLCGREGRPRLADFGIARLVDTTRLTATATTVGTASYMAPEQVQGHDVTPAADVYSLGLVLLELLTGRRAFTGSAQEVAVARLVRAPDTDTDVPGAWRPLLAEMTERAASDRPSAAEVRDRLQALQATAAEVTSALAGAAVGDALTRPMITADPGTTPMPSVLGPAAAEEAAPPDPRRWALVAAVVALLVGVAAVAAFAGNDDDPGLPTTSTTAPVLADPATTVTTEPPATTSTTEAPPADNDEDEEKPHKDNGKPDERGGGRGDD